MRRGSCVCGRSDERVYVFWNKGKQGQSRKMNESTYILYGIESVHWSVAVDRVSHFGALLNGLIADRVSSQLLLDRVSAKQTPPDEISGM